MHLARITTQFKIFILLMGSFKKWGKTFLFLMQNKYHLRTYTSHKAGLIAVFLLESQAMKSVKP